jgi:hypothetical protein
VLVPQSVHGSVSRPLSFANSHPSADGNVDPGWIGTTTGVIVGKRADVGRVIASGRTRFRRSGGGMAIHVDVGMADTCGDQAAKPGQQPIAQCAINH